VNADDDNDRELFALTENVGPPIMLTTGNMRFRTLTLAVVDPQAPKKLQRVAVKVYVFPLDNSPLAIVSLDEVNIDDLARKPVSPDVLDAFVLINETLAVLQTLPPEPVEEPISSERESHEPIVEGKVIRTVGTVGFVGDKMLRLVLAMVDHCAQVDELNAAGQAARILFALTLI
jgi:hypothetical protein